MTSFITVARTCSKCHHYEKAGMLLHQMYLKALDLNHLDLNMAISICRHTRQWEQALVYLEEARKTSLEILPVSLNMTLSSCERAE